ncbi:MAG: OmpA family protein [Treponema sp.]|nr:OmpA family protein [Treponema sp.]
MFQTKKHIIMLLVFIAFLHELYAQAAEPPYFAMDFGGIAGEIMVDGFAGGIVIDPKLRLTPAITIGSKFGASYSSDGIITLEAQGYLRWNFLRFPVNNTDPAKTTTDIFIQGGAGVLGAVKGKEDSWDGSYDRTNTRASVLGDVTLGISIPLSPTWHIEASARGGYPFKYGFALTFGRKYPFSNKPAKEPEIIYRTEYVDRVRTDIVTETVYQPVIETITETVFQPVIETVTEYVPVVETVYQTIVQTVYQTITKEVVRKMMVTQIEYILFGPDISRYNEEIDRDAMALNDLVLDQIARFLIENQDCQVRLEGHANPVTGAAEEIQVLAALSANRAHEIARMLRAKGVRNEQISIVAFGGTRTITRERDHWNVNRRVELVVFQSENQ